MNPNQFPQNKIFPVGVPLDRWEKSVRAMYVLTLFLLCMLPFQYFEVLDRSVANSVFPVLLCVSCSVVAIRLVYTDFLFSVTPLPTLFLLIGLFHGFGTLAVEWSSFETQVEINASFAVSDEWLYRTISLNIVGTLILSATIGAALSWLKNFRPNREWESAEYLNINSVPEAVIASVAFLNLAVGSVVYFGLRVPASIGLIPFAVPGSIQQIGELVNVAILLLAFCSSRFSVRYLFLLVPAVVLTFATALILYSKEAIVISLAVPFIGWFLANRRKSILLFGFVVCSISYVIFFPVVTECRIRIAPLTIVAADGSGSYAPLPDRWDVALSSMEDSWFGPGNASKQDASEKQMWWLRLCYNSPQAFAMERYELGFPGDSLRDAFITVIPRFLWPNKPITARTAIEFQQLYTGRTNDESTSVGVGLFGEAYWLFGWLGVLGLTIFAGLELALMTFVALNHLDRGDSLVYLPVLLFGVLIARGIDRQIVMVYIGSVPIYFGIYIMTNQIINFFKNKGR